MTETTTFEIKFMYTVEAAQYFSITSPEELENFREKFLGVNGLIKELSNELKECDVSKRNYYGEFLGQLNNIMELKYSSFKKVFSPQDEL